MLIEWTITIFLLFWSSAYACNPNETCYIDNADENVQNIMASMNHFTTQIIQKFMYNPDVKTNVVISPWCIYVVLTLVLFGSAGDTQKELQKALQFPDADMEVLKKTFGDIIIVTDMKQTKTIDGQEYVLVEGRVVQGLFIHKDFTPVDAYAQYLKALNVELQQVDYANKIDDAINMITKWIEASKPANNSLKLTFSLSEITQIFAMSFFYFNANWEGSLFLDRSPGKVPFHTLDKKQVDVDMMKTSASLLYYDKKSSFTAVEIPFAFYGYTALFILPYKEVDAVKFVTTFKMDIVDEFITNSKMKDVDCQIPTFSFSYSVDLTDKLEELGLKQLFAGADLSNMIQEEKQKLAVQLTHSGEITVNEKRTIVVDPVNGSEDNTPPKDLIPFIADRPFLMLIRSAYSYAIVSATFFYKV